MLATNDISYGVDVRDVGLFIYNWYISPGAEREGKREVEGGREGRRRGREGGREEGEGMREGG